jgi:ABC-type multidrug transport system fused ATPase/permease subunit
LAAVLLSSDTSLGDLWGFLVDGVQETVLALRDKCTVVVIAHSATVMKHCDHMFVLDQGRITDQGSYEDLIHRSESVNKIVKAFSNSKHGP